MVRSPPRLRKASLCSPFSRFQRQLPRIAGQHLQEKTSREGFRASSPLSFQFSILLQSRWERTGVEVAPDTVRPGFAIKGRQIGDFAVAVGFGRTSATNVIII